MDLRKRSEHKSSKMVPQKEQEFRTKLPLLQNSEQIIHQSSSIYRNSKVRTSSQDRAHPKCSTFQKAIRHLDIPTSLGNSAQDQKVRTNLILLNHPKLTNSESTPKLNIWKRHSRDISEWDIEKENSIIKNMNGKPYQSRTSQCKPSYSACSSEELTSYTKLDSRTPSPSLQFHIPRVDPQLAQEGFPQNLTSFRRSSHQQSSYAFQVESTAMKIVDEEEEELKSLQSSDFSL